MKYIKQLLLNKFREYERGKRVERVDEIPVYELSPKHIQGTKLITNREALLELLPKNACVAEIGVNEGEFSEKIIRATNPKKLHLIDAWDTKRYHEGLALGVESRFSNEIDQGSVEVNRGYSTEVLPQFPDGYFDWVYIDTAHTYDVTRDELAICRRKVKESGLICGHDYVYSCWRNAVKYGVVEALHEFCVKHDWELLYLTSETHQHRSFCIQRLS